MKPNKNKQIVIKEGNNGHHHTINTSNNSEYKKVGLAYSREIDLLSIKNDNNNNGFCALLTHEEHESIPLKEGEYVVVSQQEYDFYSGNYVNVYD